MRILVTEDQKKMASFLKQGLQEAGYAVDLAETGAAAESMLADHLYDLVILDVNLPDMSGFDIARHLRQDAFKGPILILTALNTTKHKVNGLDAGADDYLTKPFEFDELLARVRALLRRQQPASMSQLRYAELEMDLVKRQVTRNGDPINLTAKEFALLEYFMRHPERAITRTEILEHVWDMHFDTESNVIDVYVNMLRKKVDAPYKTKLIQTQIGFGYILKT